MLCLDDAETAMALLSGSSESEFIRQKEEEMKDLLFALTSAFL